MRTELLACMADTPAGRAAAVAAPHEGTGESSNALVDRLEATLNGCRCRPDSSAGSAPLQTQCRRPCSHEEATVDSFL